MDYIYWIELNEYIVDFYIFLAVSVYIHTTQFALVWVNEPVKWNKKQRHKSQVHITHWPDVSWNIFRKLLLD